MILMIALYALVYIELCVLVVRYQRAKRLQEEREERLYEELKRLNAMIREHFQEHG